MTTLCTNDRSKWFTDEEKQLIAKRYLAAHGCRIVNLDITGFDRAILSAGFPMDTTIYKDQNVHLEFPQTNIRDIISNPKIIKITDNDFIVEHGNPRYESKRSRKTLAKLASCEIGSGHDAFLKGITIQFNLDYPVWLSPQIQRYSHIFYVSSTSAMQRITDLKDISKYMDPTIANTLEVKLMQNRLDIYREYLGKLKTGEITEKDYRIVETEFTRYNIVDITQAVLSENSRKFTKEEFYHYIIAICPQGLMKTVEITTNALQIKNVINQRTFHKMPEWRYICEVFKSLPIWKDLNVGFKLNSNKLYSKF